MYYKNCLTVVCFLATAVVALAQNATYRYAIDLTKPQNDQLEVSLQTPAISQKTIRFFMPKIIPGTYSVSDYGLFVHDLKAFDKKGKALPVKQVDTNTWEIQKAHKMTTLQYMVEDIFDSEVENSVYMMAATNIEADTNFVIHPPGFFGYFEGMKNQPFELTVTKPADFYGSTGLVPIRATATQDVFQTGDYDLMMDSPMMYNRPDTTFINIGDTKVLVSVYAPNKQITSTYLAAQLDNLLKAQVQYLGGKLPVEKYAFILYFADPQSANPRQGALEHSYSSFYYLPEYPQAQMAPFLLDIAAHEFFHIVTPLTIHSTEISDFNFNEPVLSQHLWLYEGVTEYASDHVQVRYELITPQAFLEKMQEKINNSRTQYNDTLAFTALSKNAADTYSAQYGNVYEKGALIGAMLDIRLLDLSNGKVDLQKVIQQLSQKYGMDKPFEDDALFDVIVGMTYPEIGNFFEKYVAGNEPLPYAEYFEKVGVNYQQEPDKMVATLGKINFGYNQEQQRIEVANVSNMNEFGKSLGFRKGDLMLKVQGVDVTPAAAQGIFSSFSENTKANDQVEVVVGRKNDAGDFEEVRLTAPAVLVPSKGKATLSLADNAPIEKLRLRDQWLDAKPLTARPEDVESIDAIIKTLYDVISGPAGQRDWDRFHSLFTTNASMSAITPTKSGARMYVSMTPNEYQEKNGPFFTSNGFWEEELGRQEMKFGELATVVSAYQFRLKQEGKPEQRGINSIQLVYDQNRWWIANIIWNTEGEENKIPQNLLKK